MINIGLLGLGTVGSGVYEILNEKNCIIEKVTGTEVRIRKILVQDLEKDRGKNVEKGILTDNALNILEDKDIDIIVEVMGGIEEAYGYIKMALENGKHVVTANKAVLSEHLYELNKIAKENNKALLFEASVAGGIPIVKTLKAMIDINSIIQIKGILNGTTNFILSKMTEEEIDFNESLKLAQKLGYAEADPTDDIEGYDAARKMAILSSIAFHKEVNLEDVECRGITSISALDIRILKELGFTVKLIGSAAILENAISAQVEPVLISKNAIMAKVENTNNIVLLKGDIVGELQFYGQGAGKNPTANAVVSDIVDVINKKYNYIDFENYENKIKKPRRLSDYYFRVYLENKEEDITVLEGLKKLGINYNVLKKGNVLILILQEINNAGIENLVNALDIVDKSCYIKIDESQSSFVEELILENFNNLAV